MIAPQCLRSQQHLSGLLTGELTETVAADMTEHLEQCEDCRRKLESLAAGNQWWQDARQYLSDDELDIRGDATQPPDGETINPIVEIEDLLCGFLEPSTNREMLGCLDAYEIRGGYRLWGYGDRPQGPRLSTESACGDQSTGSALRDERRGPTQIRSRSTGGGSRRASTCHRHPRCQFQRAAALPGDAVRDRPIAPAVHRRAWTAGASRCSASWPAGGSGAARRSFPGTGTSRHQAGQYLAGKWRSARPVNRLRPGSCHG